MTNRWTRRRVLTAAAAGAGAAAMPYLVPRGVLAAPGRPGANDRINIVVIGVKSRGRAALSGCRNPLARLVGICDVDEEVLANAGGGRGDVKGHVDYREVLARDDVDAVAIATPDHNHAHIAVAACKAGKDVFCEKPMTLTIREGRAMVEAVRRYGRVCQVGNQRRSDGSYAQMMELVRNGRIGEVKEVHVKVSCSRPGSSPPYKPQPVPRTFHYDLWLGPAPWAPYDPARCHYNFRFVRAYSGGEMTNWGAHFLDLMQWGLGMDDSGPVEVRPLGGNRPADGIYDVFRDFRFEVTYANGVKGYVNMKGGGEVTFVGTEGTIGQGGGIRGVRNPTIGPDEWHCRRAVGDHFGDWLHCIRTRQDPTSRVEAGHRTATVCHLANIALELGRTVRWDPLREQSSDEEVNRLTWRPYREPYTLE